MEVKEDASEKIANSEPLTVNTVSHVHFFHFYIFLTMAFIRSFGIFLSFVMGLNMSLPAAGGWELDDL